MYTIKPVVFTVSGAEGDFSYMAKQSKYADCFFLYNENLHQFLDTADKRPGGGNSIMRPFRGVRSEGIPTGDVKGYEFLTEEVKDIICAAFIRVAQTLEKNPQFKTIVYSADKKDGKSLGASIFNPCDDVKAYIIAKIYALAGPAAPKEEYSPQAYAFAHKMERLFPEDTWRPLTWLQIVKAVGGAGCNVRAVLKDLFGAEMMACQVLKLLGAKDICIPSTRNTCHADFQAMWLLKKDKLDVVLAVLCKESITSMGYMYERVVSAVWTCQEQEKVEHAATAMFA